MILQTFWKIQLFFFFFFLEFQIMVSVPNDSYLLSDKYTN